MAILSLFSMPLLPSNLLPGLLFALSEDDVKLRFNFAFDWAGQQGLNLQKRIHLPRKLKVVLHISQCLLLRGQATLLHPQHGGAGLVCGPCKHAFIGIARYVLAAWKVRTPYAQLFDIA